MRCRNVAGDRLEQLIDELEERVDQDQTATVGDKRFKLQNLISDLRSTLEKEGVERSAFVSFPEIGIRVEDIISDPVRWFGLTYGGILNPPQFVLEDFQEAARCFAVGFTPAAIVFALRATEGVLREYFRKVTGEDPKINNWGGLTRKLKNTECPPDLLNRLNSLLTTRNEAMHPYSRDSETWKAEGARKTILFCQEIVTEMVDDLNQRNL